MAKCGSWVATKSNFQGGKHFAKVLKHCVFTRRFDLFLGTLLGDLFLATLLGNLFLGTLLGNPFLRTWEPCAVGFWLLRPAPAPFLWLKTPSLRCWGTKKHKKQTNKQTSKQANNQTTKQPNNQTAKQQKNKTPTQPVQYICTCTSPMKYHVRGWATLFVSTEWVPKVNFLQNGRLRGSTEAFFLTKWQDKPGICYRMVTDFSRKRIVSGTSARKCPLQNGRTLNEVFRIYQDSSGPKGFPHIPPN